jgi:hypothetical protein
MMMSGSRLALAVYGHLPTPFPIHLVGTRFVCLMCARLCLPTQFWRPAFASANKAKDITALWSKTSQIISHNYLSHLTDSFCPPYMLVVF